MTMPAHRDCGNWRRDWGKSGVGESRRTSSTSFPHSSSNLPMLKPRPQEQEAHSVRSVWWILKMETACDASLASMTSIKTALMNGWRWVVCVAFSDSMTSIKTASMNGWRWVVCVVSSDSMTSIKTALMNGWRWVVFVAFSDSMTSIKTASMNCWRWVVCVAFSDSMTSIKTASMNGWRWVKHFQQAWLP